MIDAHSLIHRSFHAMPPLTTPGGEPIQAVYGLASILLKILREDKPDYLAACFDRPEPTFRKEEYVEYKAQRPKTPDDLVSQLLRARELFSNFGIETLEAAGFEADDLIATLAEKFSAKGEISPLRGGKSEPRKLNSVELRGEPDLKIVILTGDLDTLQLVFQDKVVVRTFRKGVSDTFTYDEKAVYERYGLKPGELIDYKALVGDPSDNIKGISGIGPKRASDLLKKFETLENIYKNLDVDEKLKRMLGDSQKQAELAKKLVTLKRDVPIIIPDLSSFAVNFDKKKLLSYFQKLGFETLVKRLGVNVQSQIFSAKGGSVSDGEDRPQLQFEDAVFIVESLGSTPFSEDFLSSKTKVGFNLKLLIKNLWASKKDLNPPYFDLGVAFWLLDPDFKNYEPRAVFRKFLGKDLSGDHGDLEGAYGLASKKIKEFGLEKVLQNIEMPLIRILAEAENSGIAVDPEKLKDLETRIEDKLNSLTQDIYREAGEEFNINSPKQLQRILFERLKINPRLVSRTAGGSRSTNAQSLAALEGAHPIIPHILEYRESFKIQSTYVQPLQRSLGKDGRLHTEFIQTGTATGRLSSKSPNLQNIPQESIWAKDLRSAFVAPHDFSFLAFDYSQLELRILAALSKDSKMVKAFEEGQDIHQLTASKVLKIPLSKVTAEERRLAKTLNFGLIYGMGASAFAKTSGLERRDAEDFIKTYFKEFPKIRDWQEKTKSEARTLGYVQTLIGRRRLLLGLSSSSPQFVAEAERAAINQPIQGLGADIIKMAMIKVKETLREAVVRSEAVRRILSIHDELLFEVRDDMIKKIMPQIKKTMEEVFDLTPSLKVDVSLGKDWGHLKKINSQNDTESKV